MTASTLVFLQLEMCSVLLLPGVLAWVGFQCQWEMEMNGLRAWLLYVPLSTSPFSWNSDCILEILPCGFSKSWVIFFVWPWPLLVEARARVVRVLEGLPSLSSSGLVCLPLVGIFSQAFIFVLSCRGPWGNGWDSNILNLATVELTYLI